MLLCGFFSAKTQSFCGFENGDMCGFTQETETDHFDWTRTKGDTPSGDTGPAGDHTCGGVKGAGKQRAVGLGHGYSRTSLCSKPTECQWIWTMMLLGEFYKYFIGKSEFQYLRSILNRTLQISSNIFLTSTKLYPVFFKTILTKDIQRPGVYYNNLSRIKGPIHPVIWLLRWPSSLHERPCWGVPGVADEQVLMVTKVSGWCRHPQMSGRVTLSIRLVCLRRNSPACIIYCTSTCNPRCRCCVIFCQKTNWFSFIYKNAFISVTLQYITTFMLKEMKTGQFCPV